MTRYRGLVQALGAALTMLLCLVAWALASPVGSAPDEDEHTADIYCIHDSSTCRSDDWIWPWNPPYWAPDPADRTGSEYVGAKQAFPDLWRYEHPRELPCYVTNGSAWYAPDAAVPATCLNEQDPTNNRPATLDRLGYYPDNYYRVMSLFTGSTIRESTVTWRMINALIAVVVLAGSILLTARNYRRTVAVSALVASMPMGIFLIPSVNPSSWLIVGAAAFLGPAITLLRDKPSARWLVARIGFLILCALMMTAGRSEGIAHVAALAVVALLLGLKAPRLVYWAAAGGVGLAGAVLIVLFQVSDSAKIGFYRDWLRNGLGGSGTWDGLMTTPGAFFSADGFHLGWLDVVPPPMAVVATQAAFWGAAALGLAVIFWRKGIALAAVAGALLIVPATLAAGGWPHPPARYFLPLVFMLAFVVLAPAWGRWLPRWSRTQWIFLGGALSVANSLSLLYLTVRYVSGISPGTTNPRNLAATLTPQWWWGAWLDPFGNWLLGTLAFMVAVSLLFSLPSIREGAKDHPELEEPEAPDDPYHGYWNPPDPVASSARGQ